MRKYYACFNYNHEKYVIRFKSKRFRYNEVLKHFIDDQYCVHSIRYMVAWAAFNISPEDVFYSFLFTELISHKQFIEYQISHGYKRWKPACKILI